MQSSHSVCKPPREEGVVAPFVCEEAGRIIILLRRHDLLARAWLDMYVVRSYLLSFTALDTVRLVPNRTKGLSLTKGATLVVGSQRLFPQHQ
jgi:hypothetical protein